MGVNKDWWDEYTIEHLGKEIRVFDRDKLEKLHGLLATELGLDCGSTVEDE